MGMREWKTSRKELLPQNMREWVGDAALFVDFLVSFVKELGQTDPQLQASTNRMGAPSFDRRMLLAVWLYGLRSGITSCRKLEEACRLRVDFLYLTGRQLPDHSTLWLFFNEYRSELKPTFKRLVEWLRSKSLVRGEVVLIDGTMVASAGSRHQLRKVEKLEKQLSEMEEEWNRRLEQVTEGEGEEDGSAQRSKEQVRLEQQIASALAETKNRDEKKTKKVCLTDPESAVVKYKDYGAGPGYNVQVSSDAETGMVLSVEATTDKSDVHQLARQTQNAQEMLGSAPTAVVADAGYHTADELAEVEGRKIDVYCPEKPNANNTCDNPFSAQHFRLDEERSVMVCPAGEELGYVRTETVSTGRIRTTQTLIYRGGEACSRCEYFGRCTKSPRGRTVKRVKNYEASRRTIERTKTELGKERLAQRRQIEHRMSDLKSRIGLRRVWVKGRERVTSSCYLRQWR